MNTSISFYDSKTDSMIKFKKPQLKITKKENKKNTEWTITGKEEDNRFKLVLETYAKKQFTMKNRGWQVYIEYAVLVKEFSLKLKNKNFNLHSVGRGVGTFEDAYGFVF